MIGTLTHRGIRTESAAATFKLDPAITASDIGKPVSIDPANDFTVKLAFDGAEVVGYLESYEDRTNEQQGLKLGAVSWHLCAVFTYEGTAPTRGGNIIGSATAGTVKDAGATGLGKNTLVTAVDTTNKLVEVIFR